MGRTRSRYPRQSCVERSLHWCVAFASASIPGLSYDPSLIGIEELGYARAVLDDGKAYYGGVTRDGSFHIPNVEPGTYILSVVAHDHAFDKVRIFPTKHYLNLQIHNTVYQLRVDVPATSESSIPTIYPYIPGTPLSPPPSVTLAYPLELIPRRRNDYYAPPPQFNAMQMLKSPMVLMMLVAGILMFATPQLMVRAVMLSRQYCSC
jgi:ER membrane protein complex subunit 7